jgi:hypothetical protein
VLSSGDLATPIPDIGPGAAFSDLRMPKRGKVKDLRVGVRLDHTFTGQLRIFLRDAARATNFLIPLSIENGGSGDDFGTGPNDCSGTMTVFDDDAATPITAASPPFAGALRPEQPLSLYKKAKAYGPWRLSVADLSVAPGDTGVLGCWELEIVYKPKRKKR